MVTRLHAEVQLLLTPIGARRLFGVPMHELTGVTVGLGDLLGERAAGLLTERAAAAGSWPERLAIVEHAVLRGLADREPARPELTWACARVASRPVAWIAEELQDATARAA